MTDEMLRLRDEFVSSSDCQRRDFLAGLRQGWDARDTIERPEVTALVEAIEKYAYGPQMHSCGSKERLEAALDEYRQAVKESK